MISKLLTDVCDIQYGYAFDSSLFSNDNGLPLVRIRDVVRGYSETRTTEICPDNYIVNNGDMLIGMDGEFNIAKWQGGKALLNQRVCKLIPKADIIEPDYLYYYMSIALKAIEDKTPFVTVKHLSAKEINKIFVPMPDKQTQRSIAKKIALTEFLINSSNIYLNKLDELIKSRFVEMFGDPETNPCNWDRKTLNDVCSSIVRGPFGSALKKEFFVEADETTYKVYEQKHAIQKSATIGTYYVNEEKFNELKRFECVAGDILMSCSGTMGELYQLPQGCERGIINQALCKFTLNDSILPIFFLTYMKQTISKLETKGSGIKNIAAISYVKAMPINLPPISVQQQYVDFVTQVKKQKATVQQSIDKLETLKKSLMQEYFG